MSDNQSNLHQIRHSAEHVLTQAMHALYGTDKIIMAMGPATDDGFYFDFDTNGITITEADFPKIEKEMWKIINKNLPIVRKEIDIKEAKKLFKDNPYKQEWLDLIEGRGEKATIYWTGEDFVDLCAGPHTESTKNIKAFKLLSVAGAYWHGDEKNKMLTRIYGTAFESEVELKEYLHKIEEAKKRDHRKIGKELELFTFSPEVGLGLTLWLPNGAIIRREIENYMVAEQTKMGYHHVYSPHIGQKSLWEKSGHWNLYREKMYSPMDVDGIEYLTKPMTCPMHIQSFQFKPRSYRDLPYRIAEIASVYRYEQSGELNGLLRVRAFTQDDAHIFCTQGQAVEEFIGVFHFIQRLYAAFGFTDYRVRLGVRSQKEKYLGSDSLWKKAEEKAVEALKKSKSPYFISEGDAAFYGPKADFLIKDALGREWQCGTVQIDFMLPERFGLTYVGPDNQDQIPVMIHRAPLGSLERFLAILIEHYAGAFPLWLAPIQAVIIPIGEDQAVTAKLVYEQLTDKGVRIELWDQAESMQKKIRIAEKQKVPYMLIIGQKEAESNTVSVRARGQQDLGVMSTDQFMDRFNQIAQSKSLEL
jgi:threonyl-tRNA synthetase